MTQDAFHSVNKVLAVFLARANDAGQNRMSPRTGLAPIAAISFANEDSGPNLAFGGIVGWGHSVHVQKGQQMPALFAQEFGEAGVLWVSVVPGQQPIQRASKRPQATV